MQQKVAGAIGDLHAFATIIEIGAGSGALTFQLLPQQHPSYWVVELDPYWAEWLKQKTSKDGYKVNILNIDFLKLDLQHFAEPIYVIGNFPYNISSQILFKIIEAKTKVAALTGMFQKEVAQRITSSPGSKDYGILSVLIQAYYTCEYLFDIPPVCFTPLPKVISAMISLKRHNNELACNEKLFRKVVKTSFNQRRKTLRNSLKTLLPAHCTQAPILSKRPEQLDLQGFIQLTHLCENATE